MGQNLARFSKKMKHLMSDNLIKILHIRYSCWVCTQEMFHHICKDLFKLKKCWLHVYAPSCVYIDHKHGVQGTWCLKTSKAFWTHCPLILMIFRYWQYVSVQCLQYYAAKIKGHHSCWFQWHQKLQALVKINSQRSFWQPVLTIIVLRCITWWCTPPLP